MSLLWTIGTYAASILVVIGIYKTKIDTINERVNIIESKDRMTETTLTGIQVQLADINAKLALLLKDKSLKE